MSACAHACDHITHAHLAPTPYTPHPNTRAHMHTRTHALVRTCMRPRLHPPARMRARTWSSVKTLNVCSSTSGAKPGHSLAALLITPATNEPWPRPSLNACWCVQSERALMLRTWGWPARMPVSNTPTCGRGACVVVVHAGAARCAQEGWPSARVESVQREGEACTPMRAKLGCQCGFVRCAQVRSWQAACTMILACL